MDEGLTRLFGRQEPRSSLGTKIIGKKIYAYDLVTSTNDLAHFLAQGNEPDGVVVFAKGQTKGRGRLGKTWVSPYGKGLYFSLILRPSLKPEEGSRITLTVALAVASALNKIGLIGACIKWPNDILLDSKKVCGILTEMKLAPDKVEYVISGVGLNVNASESELPEDATSLKVVTEKEFDIQDLSHILMREIDYYYQLLLNDRFAEIIKMVKDFSSLILGGRVRVSWEDRTLEGYAVDFNEYGGLVIRKDNGTLEELCSGHLETL